jgi:hypothetical protein
MAENSRGLATILKAAWLRARFWGFSSEPGNARRANRCANPDGLRSTADSRRGPAWCRIYPAPVQRSQSRIPTRCLPDCGWRFRATPGPVKPAKWCGAAARRWASNSYGSLDRRHAIIREHETASPDTCRAAVNFCCAGRAGRPSEARTRRARWQRAPVEGSHVDQFMRCVWRGFHEARGVGYLRQDRRRHRRWRRRLQRIALNRKSISYDIGGATNCANPGRAENPANQRSRLENLGLVMPSTPSQRRA